MYKFKRNLLVKIIATIGDVTTETVHTYIKRKKIDVNTREGFVKTLLFYYSRV